MLQILKGNRREARGRVPVTKRVLATTIADLDNVTASGEVPPDTMPNEILHNSALLEFRLFIRPPEKFVGGLQ